MKHYSKEGDYLTALSHLLEQGGQLYPGRHKGSSNSVIQGNKCTTYWAKDSGMRTKVLLLAAEFGLEPEHQTYSRMAKWYIEKILDLKYKETYHCKEFKNLAKDGYHWHYTYFKQGDLGYCFELDVSRAYLTSLLSGKSLFYDKYRKWIDDGGALENLRNSEHLLTRDFRMVLVGTLASYSKNFQIRTQTPKGAWIPENKSINWVSYGAAFNAAHGAILRLYNIMRKAHNIGGEDIVRMHTDSLLIKASIDNVKLQKLISHFLKNGFQLKTKAEGRAYFFDLNCGFVGRKPYGFKKPLLSAMREKKVSFYEATLDGSLEFQWDQYRLPPQIDKTWMP